MGVPPQGITDKDYVFGYTGPDGMPVKGAIETDVYLQAYTNRYPEQWAMVQKCIGLDRQKGRHACFPMSEAIFVMDGLNRVEMEIGKCDNKMVPTGTGQTAPAKLLYQGEAEVWEFQMDNGKTVRCTPDHQVLTVQGWMPIALAMWSQVDLLEEK
jgi:hypothetical protein